MRPLPLVSCSFALACARPHPAPPAPPAPPAATAPSTSPATTIGSPAIPEPLPPTPQPEATPDGPAEPDMRADQDGDAWIKDAVQEALYEELMPGTSGEPEPGRAAVLRTFFQAHPEYREAKSRAPLWAHACGLGGTEAAHAYLTQPPPKTPVEVTVDGADWRVFVAHASDHCTGDDWSMYSYEASEAARDLGAVTAWGNAQNDVLVIRSGDQELKRVPLSGQGYIAVRAGEAPQSIPYDPGITGRAIREYFGPTAGD